MDRYLLDLASNIMYNPMMGFLFLRAFLLHADFVKIFSAVLDVEYIVFSLSCDKYVKY